MSAITPYDIHRDDIDAGWQEVAAEHAALKEFRELLGDCDDATLRRRWQGLAIAAIAMKGPMAFHKLKREADALMKDRGMM